MITQIVIAEDTLSFFVDTGADASVISPEFADRLVGRDKTTDIWGITKKLPTTRIGEVKWGDMIINNMVFSVAQIPLGYAGIIGGDLLRNFSFTIDNQREKFIITTESRNIANSNIIAVPFARMRNNSFFISADWLDNYGHKILNNQTYDSLLIDRKGAFLFDTGFTSEFSINKETFESLDHSKQRRWSNSVGGFFDRTPDPDDFSSFFLSNLQIGNIVFSNVLVGHSNTSHPNNIMGTVFMRRFQSITIDYLREKIYFELPNDYERFFSFSSGRVDIAPLAHWHLFFNTINSLGVTISGNDSILVVSAILEDKRYSTSLNRGDTIVGMNNILFTEEAFRLSVYNDELFYLDTAVCKRQIRSQIFLSDRVDLHFVKDNSLHTVALHRDTCSAHTPMMSYSFGRIPDGWMYFVMNHPKSDQFTYSRHILPWSTLIGKEKEFAASWGDGREVVSTNVLPINENVSVHRGKRNSEITYSDWQMQLLMRMFQNRQNPSNDITN